MKRDMDLIRQILLDVEAKEDMLPRPFHVEGYPKEQVSYHVILLGEAGLIEARHMSTQQDVVPTAYPVRLTWEGHEFLGAAKNDTAWQKAKLVFTDKAGGIAYAVLKEFLIQAMKQSVLGV